MRDLDLLELAVAAEGGTQRAGQVDMCEAVSKAVDSSTALFVQAPTGTGKTYAFLIPVMRWLAEQKKAGNKVRAVVTTATKALQDQLVGKDLPFLEEVLKKEGVTITHCVLKGRNNYLCKAKLETTEADRQLGLFYDDRLSEIQTWEKVTLTGDRGSYPGDMDDELWRSVSVGSDACPGAGMCEKGASCWTELARQTCEHVDLIVVNSYLYAAHLANDQQILPEHQLVVIDEAHSFADILAEAGAVEMSAGRLFKLGSDLRKAGMGAGSAGVFEKASALEDLLASRQGQVVGEDAELLVSAKASGKALEELANELEPARVSERQKETAKQLKKQLMTCVQDLYVLATRDPWRVSWVSEKPYVWKSAPIDVSWLADSTLYPGKTVIACSATLCVGKTSDGKPDFENITKALGADRTPRVFNTLAVDTPFDYKNNSMLYVPKDTVPDPRNARFQETMLRELVELVKAADGRSLALFTSWKAVDGAKAYLRDALQEHDIWVASQRDAPRDQLVARLLENNRGVICATHSFWTGLDIPGDDLIMVSVDKLPFARPDDIWQNARRNKAKDEGQNPFMSVDIPQCAIQLTQGVGRLIRRETDKGVVAVFDSRLATARYRNVILDSLPPMKRSIKLSEATEFLDAC